jgi:hypothetical protein
MNKIWLRDAEAIFFNLVHPVNPVDFPGLRYTFNEFTMLELFTEIIATYSRHGWELRRVLLRPETRAKHEAGTLELFKEARLNEADFDALWFARASHAGREAWELRLVAEQPYALFEAFEADEDEELREDARLEMENLMREQTLKA